MQVFHVEGEGSALLTLGDGPLRELARGEVGELDTPAERRRRACDEERGRVGRLVDGGEEEGERCLGKVKEAVAMERTGITPQSLELRIYEASHLVTKRVVRMRVGSKRWAGGAGL